MLIKGDAPGADSPSQIRGSRAPDHLKEIVYRLPRRASEAVRERRRNDRGAPQPPAALKAGVLRTLKGVHLAFTAF